MSLGGLVDKILSTDPVVMGLIPAMEHLFSFFLFFFVTTPILYVYLACKRLSKFNKKLSSICMNFIWP